MDQVRVDNHHCDPIAEKVLLDPPAPTLARQINSCSPVRIWHIKEFAAETRSMWMMLSWRAEPERAGEGGVRSRRCDALTGTRCLQQNRPDYSRQNFSATGACHYLAAPAPYNNRKKIPIIIVSLSESVIRPVRLILKNSGGLHS